ncbi:MAG TPA: GNAT family N-acetyltransferase [Stellaceae bacterium]|nr:GNAT family N-acetyltransferase [Stellaceae bacterium]
MEEITIAPPRAEDFADWRRLYEGYATFYKMPMNDEIAGTVWRWLLDPAHPLEALVARTGAGRVVGLAHFRPMPRPLTGSTAGFLDDLFVDPALRGSGLADRLLEAMGEVGRKRGWSLIRWLTADNNFRARGVYDRHAQRTMWITYQMDLGAAPSPATR